MNLADLARIRLFTQQTAASKFKTPKEVVGWMGAMQAQDYLMSKWAVGLRLPGSTDRGIQQAFDKGEILRTHVLRPTWHLVSADDIYWMLALTAPRIKAGSQSRHNQQGLTAEIFSKSNAIIEKALVGGKQLSRDELVVEFRRANFPTGDNQENHLLIWAELEGLICSGATKKGKPTYTLLEERVPVRAVLSKEEALAKLAEKYFTSHGPASLADFGWWSGLSIREARQALELARPLLKSETIDSQSYWYAEGYPISQPEGEIVRVFPAYDEYLISYTDRSASLTFENQIKAVSTNGIFRPVIVVNGRVIGIWSRTTKNDRIKIRTTFFEPPDKTTLAKIETEFLEFGGFLEKDIEIIA